MFNLENPSTKAGQENLFFQTCNFYMLEYSLMQSISLVIWDDGVDLYGETN